MTGQFISIGRFLHQNVGPFGFFFIGSSLHWSDLTGSWLGSGPDQLRSCVWRVLGHSLDFERDKRLFCSFFSSLWLDQVLRWRGGGRRGCCVSPTVRVCLRRMRGRMRGRMRRKLDKVLDRRPFGACAESATSVLLSLQSHLPRPRRRFRTWRQRCRSVGRHLWRLVRETRYGTSERWLVLFFFSFFWSDLMDGRPPRPPAAAVEQQQQQQHWPPRGTTSTTHFRWFLPGRSATD